MYRPVLQKAEQAFAGSVTHLQEEHSNLQIGRASSGLVENLMVDAYGSMQPVKAVASVSVPDARTVQIQPWDKAMLGPIEKAVTNSDLDLNPTNNGIAVILSIPSLTEDRRKELVKVVNRLAEEAKISVRNARHDAMSAFKRMEGDSDITEDDRKHAEKKMQEAVDKTNTEIGDLAKKKEEAIMTI